MNYDQPDYNCSPTEIQVLLGEEAIPWDEDKEDNFVNNKFSEEFTTTASFQCFVI
jgi:intein-encoded DNA endonuclease-like protein